MGSEWQRRSYEEAATSCFVSAPVLLKKKGFAPSLVSLCHVTSPLQQIWLLIERMRKCFTKEAQWGGHKQLHSRQLFIGDDSLQISQSGQRHLEVTIRGAMKLEESAASVYFIRLFQMRFNGLTGGVRCHSSHKPFLQRCVANETEGVFWMFVCMQPSRAIVPRHHCNICNNWELKEYLYIYLHMDDDTMINDQDEDDMDDVNF